MTQNIGRYEIVGLLATGGMAEILLARIRGPSGFERPVVVKRILPHLADAPAFVEMFLDEARLAAGIRHENVVQVTELGESEGELFLVMEYLEGESLASLQRRMNARHRQLDYGLVAHVVAEACAGLHAAHELKGPDGSPLDLVHRDVSPQNLFVTYSGAVKVLDFGVAKATGRLTKTGVGEVKGKFAYMSPEQCENDPLDRRSDVFSLGIVLYELATQRRLFARGSPAATLRAVLNMKVPPPSIAREDFPQALVAILDRALARDVSDRYGDAQEMRRDLLRFARTQDIDAPRAALSKLMGSLFIRRIEEKRAMLTAVGRGEEVEQLPRGEVEQTRELPTVDAIIATPEPTKGSSRRGVWQLVLASLLVGAVGIGAALWMGFAGPPRTDSSTSIDAARDDDRDGTTTVEEPTPIPVAAAPAEIEEASRADPVAVTALSEPPGATVVLDGEARGEAPLELELERSDDPIELRFELRGHRPTRVVLTPNESTRVVGRLRPRRDAQAREAGRDPEPSPPTEPPLSEEPRAFPRY